MPLVVHQAAAGCAASSPRGPASAAQPVVVVQQAECNDCIVDTLLSQQQSILCIAIRTSSSSTVAVSTVATVW